MKKRLKLNLLVLLASGCKPCNCSMSDWSQMLHGNCIILAKCTYFVYTLPFTVIMPVFCLHHPLHTCLCSHQAMASRKWVSRIQGSVVRMVPGCGAQLQTADGPGPTSVSSALRASELVDLCWACLVSNDRLLLINGLEPIRPRWVQHKPHALNMTGPPSAAVAGEGRGMERKRELRGGATPVTLQMSEHTDEKKRTNHLIWCCLTFRCDVWLFI